MPSTLLHPAPTRTRETGKTKRVEARQAICEAALLIPGVESCVPHPDPEWNHVGDRNRWLLVGFECRCEHVRTEPTSQADVDGLGHVRANVRIYRQRLCPKCWSDEDSARLRAINDRLSPDALFATVMGARP